jgi:hypothetical protein
MRAVKRGRHVGGGRVTKEWAKSIQWGWNGVLRGRDWRRTGCIDYSEG